MSNDGTPAGDDFEDAVERAVEDKLDGVLAADATGLVRSETVPLVVETPNDQR